MSLSSADIAQIVELIQSQAGPTPAGEGFPLSVATIFRAGNTIINDSGEFFYSPAPGAGNLISSSTSAAGTDPYGNAYLAGDVVYGSSGGTQLAMQLSNAGVTFYSAASQAGPWGSGASMAFDSTNDVALGANGNITLDAGQGLVHPTKLVLTAGTGILVDGVNAPVLAQNPSVGGAEPWHSLGALAIGGWTVANARYKLLADSGLVAVQIQNLAPSTHPADGTVIWSAANGLPSGYRPSINQLVAVYSQAIGGEAPAFNFVTDGSIQVFGLGGTASTRMDCYTILSTL
jgi:hypothetical protein